MHFGEKIGRLPHLGRFFAHRVQVSRDGCRKGQLADSR